MQDERTERIKKTTSIHLAMEAKETLKKVEDDFSDNPESMRYFYDLFRNTYSGENPPLSPFAKGGPQHFPPLSKGGVGGFDKKVIGTMCIQVPEELIYAAGAVPLRLCSGANAYDKIGAEFMPAKSCPLVKATMGMLTVHQEFYKDVLSMVVIPTTCDQKKKAGDMLEEMGIKVYTLEMPSAKDTEEARDYWQNSVKVFALKLQEMTGKKITKKGVNDAIAKVSRARAEYRRFNSLRKETPSVIYGKDAFLVANAYFFDDVERWTDALAGLNSELERRKKNGISSGNKNAPRILFTGSPPIFPNLKLPLLVEETGGIVVADEVCSSSRFMYDAVAFDELNLNDMVPAIADRYLKPCTCPCFVRNNDRKRKIADMIKGFGIDGVIYQAFSGCHLYEMEHKGIGKLLEGENIPMLYIETDYSSEDNGQLSTRVEAFLESLKSRKRRSAS